MPHPVNEAVFRSQPEEHRLSDLQVEGEVPRDLRGTLLRSGPGLMEVGGDTLNFFDGHALIGGATFEDGAVRFRSRYVRTPLYEAEKAAGRMTKRRLFTNRPSRWSNLFALELGNNAMHDVQAWGDRVYAGFDFGHFALDGRTLDTIGPERWGGAVRAGEEMAPMPYRDPASGRLIGWIKTPGGVRPDKLRFVELDDAMRVVRETAPVVLDTSPAVVHDQRATASWYVATQMAGRLAPAKALWGAATVWESLVMAEGATADLLLVPRGGEARLVRVPMPGVSIAFHVINAFDDGDHVVVDVVGLDGPVCFQGAGSAAHLGRTGTVRFASAQPRPRRFVVDPKRGVLVSAQLLGTVSLEAPEVADAVHGRPYRYLWGPAPGDAIDPPDPGAYVFFNALARVDLTTGASSVWQAPVGTLVSPPAFVARAGATQEGDGWLLAYTLSEGGAAVVVLDAAAVERGPVASVALGVHLPGVSHTRWADGLRLDA